MIQKSKFIIQNLESGIRLAGLSGDQLNHKSTGQPIDENTLEILPFPVSPEDYFELMNLGSQYQETQDSPIMTIEE